MENKQLILAIGLSLLIFLGWNAFAEKMGWIQPVEQVAQVAPGTQPQQNPATTAQATPGSLDTVAPEPAFKPDGGRLVAVETPLYRAVFHSNGGILRQFYLKKYRVSLGDDAPQVNLISDLAAGQAPMGLLLDGKGTWVNESSWALEDGQDSYSLNAPDSQTLAFVGMIDGTKVRREYTIDGSSYTIKEKLTVLSTSGARTTNLAFSLAASSLATDKQVGLWARFKHLFLGGPEAEPEENQHNPTRVAWYHNSSFSEEASPATLGKGEVIDSQLHWIGIMNNYFLGAVSMGDEQAEGIGRFANGVYFSRIGKTNVALPENVPVSVEATYFFGPKEREQLEAAPNHLVESLHYGIFSIIAKPLISLLNFLFGYVHNYGLAIILMTILIKIAFWPLSQKSYKSMQQMKQLQPLMMKIREKYADDKEAMNRETMQLYKTYKVNPAGGCLPVLIQIPVFIGLYNGLLNSIELRHASFISQLPFTDLPWLADLSAPDPMLITPLIMGATMILQQKMTPTPGDPTQAKIMMLMPVIFTLLFLTFPSGLVVYWLVNNVISIGQQSWQMRKNSA